MKTTIVEIDEYEKRWEGGSRFGEPLDDLAKSYLESEGFADGAFMSECCLGWIWSQWMKARTVAGISSKVGENLSQGMQMRTESSVFTDKPLHDLLLLVSASLGGTESDLNEVAECVMDTGGDGTMQPSDSNQIHECAWTGMFKYFALKDYGKAAEEAESIWSSKAHSSIKGAAASLVKPWLARDWNAFRKQQKKDFTRLWNWSKKNKILVEKKTKRTIDLPRLVLVKERWCWAHCAMAMLAAREGEEVETDEFWFPPSALVLE
ncbi:MAG: hypothetical protein ACI9OD_004113 [Limisphaerales bacterium]|jgi:hypothetical protein